MALKRAADIKGGTLVWAKVDGRDLVCLKAFRVGKEFNANYLIPLDPPDGGRAAIALFYVDPEQTFKECGGRAALSIGDAERLDRDAENLHHRALAGRAPRLAAASMAAGQDAELRHHAPADGGAEAIAVGQAFANPSGVWLKVLDADSHLRPYAYVDLRTGELKHRQERTLTGLRDWALTVRRGLLGLF